MRKGGRIIINAGALTDDNGGVIATQTLHTLKGQNRERFTLACRAFVPTNVNFFQPDLYSGAATPTVANSPVSSSVVGPELQTFLNAKVTAGLITQAQSDSALRGSAMLRSSPLCRMQTWHRGARADRHRWRASDFRDPRRQ